jgi:hypothetical protein
LFGRYGPAPATTTQISGPTKSGGGIVIGGIVAFLLLSILGATGWALLARKPADASPSTAPPGAVPTPVLAETSASSANAPAAAANNAKKSPTPKPIETRPPVVQGFTAPIPTPTLTTPPVNTIVVPPKPSGTTLALGNGTSGQRCSATVSVGRLRGSSPTCSFNEKVSTGPTTLEFPCEGGTATATFSTQTFRGTATATSLLITNVDQFTFSGCRVESTQRISGSRSSPVGAYTYSERILSGSCSGVRTCTATASVDFK